MRAVRRVALQLTLCIAILADARLALAATLNDSDVEARVQYAYYTNDSRALEQVAASLEQTLGGQSEAGGAQSYLLALARFRQAQLALREPVDRQSAARSSPDNSAAARHGRACLDALEQAPRPGVKMPEILGLQAACSALLGRAGPTAATPCGPCCARL